MLTRFGANGDSRGCTNSDAPVAFVWAIRLGASVASVASVGVSVVAGTVSNSAPGTVVYALATSRVYHRAARCTANCRNTDEKKYTVKIVHRGLLGANV